MIDSFSGENRFLSNFYDAPVLLDGVLYPTTEHAYQAAKCLDDAERGRMLAANLTPGQCKRWGRSVKIREDWEQVKIPIMYMLLRQKFKPGSVLAAKLLATYPQELVEGNTWSDTFWGVCKGVGKNHLGDLLEKIRFDLWALHTLKG